MTETPTTRAADRRTLAAVRRVLRERRNRPDGGDLAYAVYLAVMLAIIVAAPIARAAILGLADALPSSPDAVLLAAAAAAVCALLGIAALAGAQSGPARAGLPEIDLLHTTGLSRSLLLGRTMLLTFAGAALAGCTLAGVLVAALAVRGDSEPAGAILLLLGGAGLGLIAAAAALVGQLGRRPRWIAAAGFGALAIVLWCAPSVSGYWLLPAACVIGLAGAVLAPFVARRLSREALREQSERWNAVSMLALSGELRAASSRLGAPVSTGRRWRWRVPRPLAGAILLRDLKGLARTPARSLGALSGLALAGILFGVATAPTVSASMGLAAILGAAAALLAYAAIGPWCRGLRAAGESAGASSLLPLSTRDLLLRHSMLPSALAAAVLAAAGALGANAGGGDPRFAAIAGVVAACLVVLLRVSAALKGPLPLRLLAPVPTPAGDMAAVNVLLWSLDGVIWAAVLGGAVAAVATVSWIGATVVAVISMALLVIWAASRLRAAGG